MIEFLHRPFQEANLEDELVLKELTERGVRSHGSGLLLFAGFSSEYTTDDIYHPPKRSTYAVTSDEWKRAIEDSTYTESPVYYAWSAADEGRSGYPAVGVFDGSVLAEDIDDGPLIYVPPSSVPLAETCLRIVVWDQ